jgi:hypothetical protein
MGFAAIGSGGRYGRGRGATPDAWKIQTADQNGRLVAATPNSSPASLALRVRPATTTSAAARDALAFSAIGESDRPPASLRFAGMPEPDWARSSRLTRSLVSKGMSVAELSDQTPRFTLERKSVTARC